MPAWSPVPHDSPWLGFKIAVASARLTMTGPFRIRRPRTCGQSRGGPHDRESTEFLACIIGSGPRIWPAHRGLCTNSSRASGTVGCRQLGSSASDRQRYANPEYRGLLDNPRSPSETKEFGDLERTYATMADNQEWLARNTIRPCQRSDTISCRHGKSIAASVPSATTTMSMFCGAWERQS
jgi:hypothetical protein